jgi:hypothetical protein
MLVSTNEVCKVHPGEILYMVPLREALSVFVQASFRLYIEFLRILCSLRESIFPVLSRLGLHSDEIDTLTRQDRLSERKGARGI